jgi:hypothetical protein
MSAYRKAVLILCDCHPDLKQVMKEDRLDSLEIFTDATHFDLNKNHYTRISIADIDHEQKKILNKQAEEELNKFTLIDKDGQFIMEDLKFESAYIWYYHRFRIYFKLRQLLYSIELIKTLQKKYDFITVFAEDAYLKEIFDDVSTVDLQLASCPIEKSSSKSGILKMGLKMLVNGLSASISKKGKQAKHLIVVNAENGMPAYNEDGVFNRYYANLLKNGNPGDYALLDLSTMPKAGQEKSINVDLDKTTCYPIISSDFIWLRSATSIRNYHKRIYSFLSKISHLPGDWEDSLSGIQSWLLKEVIALNGSTSLYLLQYLMYQTFFESSSIKSVITISEHSSNERSILNAARSLQIKTIGIQHGVIGPSNISYNFLESESKYAPIPDKTFVWGEKWKDFLTDHSCYNNENTITLGQLRTDLVHNYRSTKKTDLVHSFPTDKKWILFASQPQKDENIRKQVAIDVINAVKVESNQFLIIKIHPAEDKTYYQEIQEQQKASNCIVVSEEVDLYQLLATSDIVITCFSTVGGEATFFNKPIITYDPLREDIAQYAEHHIAEQVTNASELTMAIENLLDGTKDRTQYYEAYIKNYVHKVDGQTTQRYMDAIAKL